MGAQASVVLVFGLLFSVPLALRAIGVWTRSLAANRDATALHGHYHRWELTCWTGRVLTSGGYTKTTGYGTSYAAGGSGIRIYTEYHNTFRLHCAGGQQVPVEVINFSAGVNQGDYVSVFWAKKGRKHWVMAVLNHTTSMGYFNDQEIFKVTAPRHGMLIFEMVAFTLLSCGVSLIPMLLFIAGQKRQFKKFKRHGVMPMWERGKREAASLAI